LMMMTTISEVTGSGVTNTLRESITKTGNS
jgi:hypothetical protein